MVFETSESKEEQGLTQDLLKRIYLSDALI